MNEACIRFAPVFTLERLNAGVRAGRTMYDRGSLALAPGRSDVPLIVDHDFGREIGYVHTLEVWEDTDGPWYVARARVTDRPEWLKRGTKASFAVAPVLRSERLRELYGAEVMRRGLVDEVSVLMGNEPADRGAEVVLIEDYRPRLWREIEQVVGYAVTDDNVERALVEAQRKIAPQPWGSSPSRTRPGVLVRPNIGRILGVR